MLGSNGYQRTMTMPNDIPAKIAAIARMVYERRLTDIAGGNISVRDGDEIYITPTAAGQKFLWDLQPEQILRAPVATDELLHHPAHSKESISHLMMYRAFPQVGAVIHAHPYNLMAFCAAEKAPKPLTLGAAVYGEMALLADAPLYSAEQGALLVAALQPKQALMAERAAAVLLPKHGIFVAGKNLNTTLDCLERMENSAYCNLMVRLID